MVGITPEKRARWRRYFEQRLFGGDGEVDAATDAAIHAMNRREDVNGVVAAGFAAASHFRQYGIPPGTPGPRGERGLLQGVADGAEYDGAFAEL